MAMTAMFRNTEVKFGVVVTKRNPHDILKANLNLKLRTDANLGHRCILTNFRHIKLKTNNNLQHILNANQKFKMAT